MPPTSSFVMAVLSHSSAGEPSMWMVVAVLGAVFYAGVAVELHAPLLRLIWRRASLWRTLFGAHERSRLFVLMAGTSGLLCAVIGIIARSSTKKTEKKAHSACFLMISWCVRA